MEKNNEYILTQGIISLSNADNWEFAKLEWDLSEIFRVEEPETCLCGHNPIIEICVIQNRLNQNTATVGNVCVKKFLGLPSDKIFQAIRRIRSDQTRALNPETIQHAFKNRWINKWEKEFYESTMQKRSMTFNQRRKRVEINNTVLDKINKRNKIKELTKHLTRNR